MSDSGSDLGPWTLGKDARAGEPTPRWVLSPDGHRVVPQTPMTPTLRMTVCGHLPSLEGETTHKLSMEEGVVKGGSGNAAVRGMPGANGVVELTLPRVPRPPGRN
jgi:hypothetical protein